MVKPDFKEHTIRKFKGINASRKGTSNEAVGLADDQFVDIVNWDITAKGTLEKRRGVELIDSVTSPITPTKLRLLLMQRIGQDIAAQPWALVTDGIHLWRVNAPPGGGGFEYTLSAGAPIANVQWALEYGGTSSASAYNVTLVRSDLAHLITPASGGIAGMTPGSPIVGNWAANTPPGTHMTLFKTRAWVINSYGGDSFASPQTAGDETKVWFSAPGNLADYGGVGTPNNFNLDHGDGDYLVATVPYNDQLLCFKTRRTYVVTVNGDPTSWQARPLSDHIGCVGRGTVKLIDGKVYFLSTEGVVRTDGAQAEIISENVLDLLAVYRDFKSPDQALDLFASHYKGKYILWLPRLSGATYFGDQALVFDIASSTWTTWKFAGGVSCLGEARVPEKHGDVLYFGSWTGNKVWRMSKNQWTDNGNAYNLSFTTKKIAMDASMSIKRNYLIGLTVKDEALGDPGVYTMTTKHDDNIVAVTARAEAPSKYSVTTIKAPGGGYGRYFQTTVANPSSTSYAAIYDMSWLMEERGLEPKSSPGGVVPVNPIPTTIWTVGPDARDKLNAGWVVGRVKNAA